MSQPPPNVLSVAGSDPSGGAGVHADLKTFSALGVYGMAAITALTAQNTKNVSGVHRVPAEFLEQQLRAIFEDIKVDVVKIGMIGSPDSVRVIASVLREYKPAHIVLDPVMIATSGDALIDDETKAAMIEHLCPLAHVVTPNVPEYEALGNVHYNALLLKGGHAPKDGIITDSLIIGDERHDFDKLLIEGEEFHGTGCTLSSALACYLAHGYDLPDAVKAAQDYVHEAIAAHADLTVGGGAKPLRHNISVKSPNTKSALSEFDVIERYFSPLSNHGLGNDAAIFDVPNGHEIVVTTDTLNTGVHVPKNAPADLFAGKALRTNLSDLASMGARPYGYQLALSLPHAMGKAWYDAFCSGLRGVQDEFGITLTGGDTTTQFGSEISVSITAFGLVETGQALPRSGARDGDWIVVSGTIGDAALGLDVLRGVQYSGAEYFVDRYYRPTPRLALGQAAIGLVNAAIDISDGVLADIGHVARQSGLCAHVNIYDVPVSSHTASLNKPWQSFLSKGDDYELAMAVSPENLQALQDKAQSLGVPITVVGRFKTGEGLEVLDGDAQKIDVPEAGWTHF